ncbi:MAG TPA: 50S ribosomal protein L36 [Candidatus Paceibacterota bacterium]|nr:50S ribosomal protein L36 [Candidatus Paceibacterota bacterium]
MKIRSTIKKRCAQCKIIKRRGHLYIICKNKPRHKQKQA